MFSWMKNLVMYLILSGICINLAPGNNYKKYINFFTGLVIILIAAEPISYILHFGKKDMESIYNGLALNPDIKNIEGMGELYNYYDMSLKNAIEQTLLEAGYEAKINCITNEENELIRLYVYFEAVDIKGIEPVIKKLINEVYNIDINSIYVVRR